MSSELKDSSRREFLKIAGISTSILGLGGCLLPGCTSRDTGGEVNELFEIFSNPPSIARPFFRWWWNGNAVTKKEITRELELIKKAGAGGVEINPIAMPEMSENTRPGLIWLSEEWCQALVHAVEESKRLGLITDLIVGTGWPFGGEFIEPEETLQGLTFETIPLKEPGPVSVSIRLPEDPDHERILKVALIPVHATEINMITELSDLVDIRGRLDFELPQGNHILMIIRWRNTFRTVFQGAPGAAGAVLDHFNKQAVRKYLQNMSDKLKLHFGGSIGNGIRSLFCDSIELEGANWTDDLSAEFNRRRGYDLEPYLPLLYVKQDISDSGLQDVLRRVRYDFSLTLAEFFMERFIIPYHDWCKENNVQSRYQAYGHPWLYTDMIDGFMVPDIPEGDQWLFNPGWSLARIEEIRYAIWNKYASSGGHLAGKTIISSEAMTNTSGVFRASLGYIKQATDLNFVAGINHLVLHGFNYSPPEAGFPGWVRYGCYFNENNTWWKFFPLWADYTSRISAVLQHSEPVSQLAIMGPTADVWSDDGLDRNPFNMTPWYLHSLWQAFNHNGICSDYINKHIIMNGMMENGRFKYGRMSYDTLVLCHIRTIDPEVLHKIYLFLKEGLKIIFIGEKPSAAPGLLNAENRDSEVREIAIRLFSEGASFMQGPDQENTDAHQGLTYWTSNLIDICHVDRGISITPNDYALFYIQKEYKDQDIFFFSNSDGQRSLDMDIDFMRSGRTVRQWCPETLERKAVHKNSNQIFKLHLSPLESVLLVLSPPAGDGSPGNPAPEATQPHELSGPWDVQAIHRFKDSVFSTRLDRLIDLSGIAELEDFSGEITYTLHFDLDHTSYTHIHLGEVFDVAVVTINGAMAGTHWWGKKPVSIPEGVLKSEGNTCIITVYNRLFNYCASLKDNPVASYWIERNRHKSRLPTGLAGPVALS